MQFFQGDEGDIVYWIDDSPKSNKNMEYGNPYQIVGLEFPKAHFRGRFMVVCEDGIVRSFYPKRFSKTPVY